MLRTISIHTGRAGFIRPEQARFINDKTAIMHSVVSTTLIHRFQFFTVRHRDEVRDVDSNFPMTFHGLRHTYAVLAIKSGDDIKTVQENLGHATAAFALDVYGHVTAQTKQTSADRMEQLIRSISAG